MVTNLRKERAPIELGAVALEGRTRAFLKLQEGCDQFCSFCIVPTSRGTSRSVEPRRIFDALDSLAASGFREVILTGVHLGGYGRDLDPPVSLEALLEMVAERSPIDRVQDKLARPRGIERPNPGNHGRERKVLPASPSAASGRDRRDVGADAPALRHRALQRSRRTNPRSDALGGYRHRSYRRLSRRDPQTSTITLSLSKRCRLPTFTSSRTP